MTKYYIKNDYQEIYIIVSLFSLILSLSLLVEQKEKKRNKNNSRDNEDVPRGTELVI